LLVKKKLPSATNINKSVVFFLSFLSFTKASAGTLSRGAQQQIVLDVVRCVSSGDQAHEAKSKDYC